MHGPVPGRLGVAERRGHGPGRPGRGPVAALRLPAARGAGGVCGGALVRAWRVDGADRRAGGDAANGHVGGVDGVCRSGVGLDGDARGRGCLGSGRQEQGGARHWLWLGIVGRRRRAGRGRTPPPRRPRHRGVRAVHGGGAAPNTGRGRRRGRTLRGRGGGAGIAVVWACVCRVRQPGVPGVVRRVRRVPETRWSPETQSALQRFAAHFGLGR